MTLIAPTPPQSKQQRTDARGTSSIATTNIKTQIDTTSTTGADILIGHSCFMATHMGLIGEHPVLERYYQRLQQRPAYQRAYPEGGT